MRLSTGERLGPYIIVGPVGAGGMGEVYRARDTRLGRDVAVKVLRAGAAEDGERVRRFELEARAAGLLKHPNILAIHDVGRQGMALYIVTEMLEGQSLRVLLQRGKPLEVRRVVDFALQIAHGLSAAHERGIVHRDLKPENVFVTRDERVKILDFGLVRITSPAGDDRNGSTIAALRVRGGTLPGTVLGTVGYMAPEQVRGEHADPRSDIFSLGLIVHEMLSGERTFSGDSAIEVMSAILSQEPRELSLAGSEAVGLGQIVRQCLEKDPARRVQSARDLALQLESLVPPTGGDHTPVRVAQIRRRRWWPALIIVGAAVLVASGLAFVAGQRSTGGQRASFRQLTFRRGTVRSARFLADGRAVIYGAAWEGQPAELFLVGPRNAEARALGLAADVLSSSSSGELAILLRRGGAGSHSSGTLAQASLAGGVIRELLQDVEDADWSPNGQSLAVVRLVRGQSRLEYPLGRLLLDTPLALSDLRISRDGQRIAFIEHPGPGAEAGSVVVIDRSGNRRVLADGWVSALGLAWSPSADEVWFTAGEAGAAPALRAVTLSGRQRVILRSTGRLRLHDVTRAGQVLLSHDDTRAGIAVRHGSDAAERDLAWSDSSMLDDLAPDGKTLLFTESGGAAVHAIYLRPTDGSPAVRVGDGFAAGFSPDGRRVLALAAARTPELMLLPTGAGEPIKLALGQIVPLAAGWFPDGERVLIAGREPGRAARLYVSRLDRASPVPITPEGVTPASFAASPDGRLVAVLDTERRIAIYPADGGDPQFVSGLAPGHVPSRWSDDGAALYVFRHDKLPVRVLRVEIATGRAKPVLELMPADPAGLAGILTVKLTSDARTYAYGYRRVLSELYAVEGLH